MNYIKNRKIIKKILLAITLVGIMACIIYGIISINQTTAGKTLSTISGYVIVATLCFLTGGVLFGYQLIKRLTGYDASDDNNSNGLGGITTIAKSINKGNVVAPENVGITFADVAGADEEKQELQEIVEYLKHPDKFTAMKVKLPRGVLLSGPPGTGKTLLAKAVAGEAGVSFLNADASSFMELYVGMGARRVRQTFDKAKQCSPCIVFIDEIDAIGKARGSGRQGSDSEREQTLNQLLVEMDGFSHDNNIVVIGATNRPDMLDPALLRPGRFDRKVQMRLPDVKGRLEILKIHAKDKVFSDDFNMETLAKLTPGCSGADLANIINESAIQAIRNNHTVITVADADEAVKRVLYGPEKKSSVISKEDLRVTAIHEVGHALTAYYTPEADPVHEISIIPRGQALGYTRITPEDVTRHQSKRKLLAHIAVMLGGRVAEKQFTDDIYTGAESDLENAEDIARSLLEDYGMSTEFGSMLIKSNNVSEKTKEKADRTVQELITQIEQQVTTLLNAHMVELNDVVNVLLQKEQITGEEFAALLRHNL